MQRIAVAKPPYLVEQQAIQVSALGRWVRAHADIPEEQIKFIAKLSWACFSMREPA